MVKEPFLLHQKKPEKLTKKFNQEKKINKTFYNNKNQNKSNNYYRI